MFMHFITSIHSDKNNLLHPENSHNIDTNRRSHISIANHVILWLSGRSVDFSSSIAYPNDHIHHVTSSFPIANDSSLEEASLYPTVLKQMVQIHNTFFF